MTSFQPPYLAEEVVLLLQHLYLRLLPSDDLFLGQTLRPRPATPLLVGKLNRLVRLLDPVFGRILDRGFPEHFNGEPMRFEDLVSGLTLGMQGDELLHEFLGERNVFGRHRLDPRVGSKHGNLLVREAYAGHKKTSDESVIGGNLFGRVLFLDCPNYGVQFNTKRAFKNSVSGLTKEKYYL